ncbi:MAG: hypothetical protein E7632_07460 [Ruminococcaceae bacterium]|nr:hypothetical protein [Oscillospiraceae bacterium]
MKNFTNHTVFENGTEYIFDGDRLCADIGDAVRLKEKIYRSIYSSEKNWLDTVFYLKDLSDVTLDFGGATLFLRDDTLQPFVLDGCRNVTIRNVVVEYERSLMDEMEIVDVRDGEIWCRQTDKQKMHFPMKAEDGFLIPLSGSKEYRSDLTEPHFFNLYKKETQTCVSMCLVRIGRNLRVIPHEQYPFKYYDLSASQRGEYIVLTGEIPRGICSDVTCAQTHAARDLSSCFIIRSKNIRLENFRVLNGGGMGILGMYSENNTLDGLKFFFDERSHGIATNAADAIHLISCFGTVEIINSVLEGMKDDALNIHGNYYTVVSVEDGVIHTKLATDTQKHPAVNAHYVMFGKDDELSVCHGGTTLVKQNLRLDRAEVTGDFTADLYVSQDTSALCPGDTIENLSIQADLHIKNCRFGKANTHLRLQTRGRILMEDCECALTILLPGDKNYWYEGSPVRDLTIRNCRFVGGRGSGYIVANPEFTHCPESPYYHSGIKVFGNTFENANALALSNCRDIRFEGNVTLSGLPFANKFGNCAEITEK